MVANAAVPAGSAKQQAETPERETSRRDADAEPPPKRLRLQQQQEQELGRSASAAPTAKRPRTAEKEEAPAAYEGLVAALRDAGGCWSAKLARGSTPPLNVPGIVACERIEAGELLCEVPAHIHFSAEACQRSFPRLWKACEALPSSSAERRAEAAQTAALALLLRVAAARLGPAAREQGAAVRGPDDLVLLEGGGGVAGSEEAAQAPELWQRCAENLLHEDFQRHPYSRWYSGPELLKASLGLSPEAQHIRAQAEYALVVRGCVKACLDGEEGRPAAAFDHLFLQAWLCLLTRKFASPRGSIFVPGVDLFNHSPRARSAGEWDEGRNAVVVRALQAHEAGDEVYICYGKLSNPQLFRTYGFTVPPPREPAWTCTFEDQELLALCDQDGPAGPQLREHFAGQSTSLHLDAALITETLAALLEACAMAGVSGAAVLRALCSRRLARYDEADPMLAARLTAVRRGKGSDSAAGCHAPAEVEAAARVRLSEYLCLAAHLEALDAAAGGQSGSAEALAEGRRLVRAQGLQEDLLALNRAGVMSPAAT